MCFLPHSLANRRGFFNIFYSFTLFDYFGLFKLAYLANQYIFGSDQARLLPEGFSFGSNLILTHENYSCYHYDDDDDDVIIMMMMMMMLSL